MTEAELDQDAYDEFLAVLPRIFLEASRLAEGDVAIAEAAPNEQRASRLDGRGGGYTQGTKMNRNPKASLSRREVNALRAAQHHSERAISSEDLRLLLAMGLAVKEDERVGLSPAGHARLEREERPGRSIRQV